MARQKVTDNPLFTVRINLVFQVHAEDPADALGLVTREAASIRFRGCVNREIRWSQVLPVKEMNNGN